MDSKSKSKSESGGRQMGEGSHGSVAACLGGSKQLRGLLSRIHSREPIRLYMNNMRLESRRYVSLAPF